MGNENTLVAAVGHPLYMIRNQQLSGSSPLVGSTYDHQTMRFGSSSMNLRRLVLAILSAAILSACSRAGATGTPAQPPATAVPQQQLAMATGTLTIAVPRDAADRFRKPAYISSATTQAALFIDSITKAAGSSTSCSSGCTISYATTAGTHTFRAEIANGSNLVLAAGSASVTVLPGAGNNLTVTLNGAAAAASWVSTTSTSTNSIVGTYSIADSSSVLITSAPAGASTAFDNAPITFSPSTSMGFSGTASFTTTGSSTTLSAPESSGNNYPFTATCSASANGGFTIGATSGTSAAGISAGQLSGLVPALSYPSSTLNTSAMHTYKCNNGTIVDASAPRFLYTANNTSGNISGFIINPATGALTAVAGPLPSLASAFDVAASGTFLYGVGINTNGVYGYTINQSTGTLTALSGSPFATGGISDQWVTTTPNGSFLYADTGSALYAFAINPSIGALTSVSGSPYAMAAGGRWVVASNSFVYAPTSASGIYAWSINSSTGALTGVPGAPFATSTPAFGASISPNGSFLYTSGNANGVYAYTINSSTGALTAVSGSPFAGPGSTPNSGSAVNPASSFFYAASAGNNLYGYAINAATGALTAMSGSPFSGGGGTWGVVVDPTGSFLYVADATANTVSAFSINSSTGVLTAVSGSPYATGTRPIGIAIGI